jgi:crossover junction endodeoxyribonuclease RuvC
VRILGIDPGYHRCGYSVLEHAPGSGSAWRLLASGAVVTDAADGLPRRLAALSRELGMLLALWQPQALAIEELYFAKNAKTALGVAQARGVVLAQAAGAGLTVAEYAPSTVKSQLTGSGNADKAQVAFMVRRLVGAGPDAPDAKALDDELDAIAVALCHSMRASSPAAAALLAAHGTGARRRTAR